MLVLNVDKLSDAQLTDAAAVQCARFGTVKHVRILPPAAHRQYAIAAVEMADPVAAEKVRVAFGDSKIGPLILIRLVSDQNQTITEPLEEDTSIAQSERAPVDILLVEDDAADVRMTREALKAAGVAHRLHVVGDGLEAISFLCRTRQFDDVPRPDVVLIDLNLPKVNGHEVLLEMRSNDELRDIPVVVLTSSQAERDIQRSFAAEANWFVTKPTGLDAYAETMRRIETLIAH